VETYLQALRGELVRRGHRVQVLTGAAGPADAGVIRRRVLSREHLLKARTGFAAGRESAELRGELIATMSSVINGFRPEIVHVQNAHHFAPELATALFTLMRPERLVNTVHDRIGEHLYTEVLALPWARTLFVSRFLERSLPPAHNAVVQYLGLDLAALQAVAEPDSTLGACQRPVVFVPARLLRWKGQTVAVSAFARLRAEVGAGTLVLCGSELVADGAAAVRTYRAELVAQATALAVAGAVRFAAFAPERIGTAYRASDVVWCPTVDEEPFGLVPLEAMAMGVPVVASRSGGMTETIVDGQTGRLVARGDAAALAEATVAILRDGDLRRRMAAQARKRAAEFAIEPHAGDLLAMYGRLAAFTEAA
jgi:glycosyltransferase involved in cell wall biosynthesis